jgi:hypothetical protein
MNLMDFEPTIREMDHQVNLAGSVVRKRGIIMTWRSKLEKGPSSLRIFHVDEIVREVRRRDNRRMAKSVPVMKAA